MQSFAHFPPRIILGSHQVTKLSVPQHRIYEEASFIKMENIHHLILFTVPTDDIAYTWIKIVQLSYWFRKPTSNQLVRAKAQLVQLRTGRKPTCLIRTYLRSLKPILLWISHSRGSSDLRWVSSWVRHHLSCLVLEYLLFLLDWVDGNFTNVEDVG